MNGRSSRTTRRADAVTRGVRTPRWWVAGLLIPVLVVSLVPSVPTPAVAAPAPVKPPVEKLDHDGGPVTGRAWTQKRVKDTPLSAPVWPTPGTVRVTVPPAGSPASSGPAALARSASPKRGTKAGNLPVWVDRIAGRNGDGLSSVDVQVVDRKAVPQSWRDRLVLKVEAAPGSSAGKVGLAVDYSAYRQAFGGSWASRLRLWQVPGCALSTPDLAACRSTPLPTTVDQAAGIATAPVSVDPAASGHRTTAGVPTAGSMVVLAAAASGKDGDFGASSLTPSATWTAGGNSGAFSWNYPVRVPPAMGLSPGISLAYSSAAVDGRSEVTNNQPSSIGEGFDYSPGYIERRYVPCAEDSKNGANSTKQSGDQCWRSDNATMSLNGGAEELIFQAGKGWHSRTENGFKIEKLTGATNGDSGGSGDGGEYWKVTGADGTQYFFGRDDLPGQTAQTNSTLTVPVFGNHPGEPCHATAFKDSDCVQAWRWNLDYVVDVRGNTLSYWYGKETNKYAHNATDTDDVTYDRASYLTRIDYGTYDRTAVVHGVTERNTSPYAQVVFDTDMRCFADCGTEADPVVANWKDTPWDQNCKASATSCPQQYQPTFWTTKRLKKITTRVWDTTKATPGWQDVESWTLSHTFAATADSTHTGLWLDRIDHTGLVGTPINMPPVTFEAVSMPNRVLTEHGTSDNWLRISSIVTETGSRIKVDYSEPDCTEAIVDKLAPDNNTRRCYPVLVPDPDDPNRERSITQWWHKYVVVRVTEDDLQLNNDHPAPSKHTTYEYVGAPAWHYADDDGLIKPDRKTWAQWRGYSVVKTRVGDTPATQTLTVTTFMRGMNGDRVSSTGGARSVTVPASLGSETVRDEDQYAGQEREQIVYNGVENRPVFKSVNVPWRSSPTASRTINGDTVEARFVDTQATYTATALGADGSRGWRTSRVVSTFDDTFGTTNSTQDDGDISTTGDEKCTTYTYNRNLDKNITETGRQTTTTALPCGTAPASVDDVISDSRVSYDGAASPDTPPVFGAATKTEQLKDWTPGTGTVWQTVSQSTYNNAGRPVTTTDIKNNTTTISYTPAVGGPLTKTVTTNVLGWTNSVEMNPYWGSTTKTVDPNNRTTNELEYDAFGRVSKAWQLGWAKAAHPTTPSARYTYVFAANRDAYPVVRSETLNPNGGYLTSYQIMDALLRPRQTQSLSLGGSGDRVVTDTIYDEVGRAATTYAAHAEPGRPTGVLWWEPEWSVPAITRTVFDQASRPTNTIFLGGDGVTNLVEKWRTVTADEGDLTKVTPPHGGTPTSTVSDIRGRTVALRQHTTPAGVDGGYQETRYEFNRKDQPVKTIDPAGNEWINRYDPKGRLWQTVDPDKGTATTGFNDADEPVSTTDARGQTLWTNYDQLGRKKDLRDGTATGPIRAAWKYDNIFGDTRSLYKGQLTQTFRYEPAGSSNIYKWQVIDFNNRYQPTGVNYVIPAVETGLNQTYIYGYGYTEATGTPTFIDYPAGGGLVNEEVTTNYDPSTGMPIRLNTNLPDPAGSMATATYTAYGERSGSIYKMPGGKYTQDLIYRDESTRRINHTSVTTETAAGSVSDLNYQYDQAGNILSIDDKPQIGPTDKQCFRQDTLGRLTTAWTPTTGTDCSTDPTQANLAGPAPYWQDWTFDTTGSRLSETSHTTAGDVNRAYTVPAGGQAVARPHAVTSMTTTRPAQNPVTTQYRYDATGNMICRPNNNQANNDCDTNTNSQTLTWNPEGKLATVATGGTTTETNLYDVDGNRIIRRDATGTTLYLPGQEIRREGTVTTGTRYYTLGGSTIASRTRTTDGHDLTWLYNDHQGTQQIAINASTQKVDVRRQDPYGNPRGTNPPWPNPKGFVGGDNDPTALTNIGARQYDPQLGRFISVDPILDLADPQQWNGYNYANNNPITNSDPTGLCTTDACISHQNRLDNRDQPAPAPPFIGPVASGKGNNRGGNSGGATGSGGGCPTVSVSTTHDNAKPDAWYSRFGKTVVGDLGGFIVGTGKTAVTDFRCMNMGDWQQCKKMLNETLQQLQVVGDLGKCVAQAGCGEIENAIGCGDGVNVECAGHLTAFAIEVAATRKLGPKRAPAVSAGEARAGSGLKLGCSFTFATPILLADGTTKPIGDATIGDEVLSTDPETGQTLPKPIINVLDNQDHELADLTIQGPSSEPATIQTSQNHPFWDVTAHAWIPAGQLQPGHTLRTPNGEQVKIVSLWLYTSIRTMRDLTIDTIHTYYVMAGHTPVLVHNANCGIRSWQDAGIDPMDATRIQHTANQSHQSIIVVGSRASGTAGANSDWDYILTGPSKARQSVRNSLPRGAAHGNESSTGADTGHDLFQNYNPNAPGYEELDPSLPHVIFDPE